MLIFQSQAKQETIPVVQQAFEQSIEQIKAQEYVLSALKQSQDVDKVWGAKVLAFEFECQVKPAFTPLLAEFEASLKGNLAQVKLEQTGFEAFVLTDLWLRDGSLHFDVAENKNQDTAAYIRDVKRVD